MGIGRTNVGGGKAKITVVLNEGQWLNNDYKPTVTPQSGVTVTQPTFSVANYAHGLIMSHNTNGDSSCSVAFPQALSDKIIYISFRGQSNANMHSVTINWSDGTTTTLSPYYTNGYYEAAFRVKDLTFDLLFHGNNTVEFGSIIVIE